jgi:hypothetical protein
VMSASMVEVRGVEGTDVSASVFAVVLLQCNIGVRGRRRNALRWDLALRTGHAPLQTSVRLGAWRMSRMPRGG